MIRKFSSGSSHSVYTKKTNFLIINKHKVFFTYLIVKLYITFHLKGIHKSITTNEMHKLIKCIKYYVSIVEKTPCALKNNCSNGFLIGKYDM